MKNWTRASAATTVASLTLAIPAAAAQALPAGVALTDAVALSFEVTAVVQR